MFGPSDLGRLLLPRPFELLPPGTRSRARRMNWSPFAGPRTHREDKEQ